MAPFSTIHVSSPLFFQPARSLPLNSATQAEDVVRAGKLTRQSSKAARTMTVCFTMASTMKSRLPAAPAASEHTLSHAAERKNGFCGALGLLRRNFLRLVDAIGKIADYYRWEMMKRIHAPCSLAITLAVAGSILLLHGQGRPEKGAPDATTRQEAKSAFENVCAACHGLDGRGGERGPDGASP